MFNLMFFSPETNQNKHVMNVACGKVPRESIHLQFASEIGSLNL